MKKRVLLALLPAAMVLAACAGAGPKAAQNNVLFQEDTLAHEELFEQQGFGKIDTRIRKAAPVRDDAFPVIGVQSTSPKTIKVSGVDTEVVSLRFVAAVNLDLDHLEDVHPVWTRVLYEADGDGYLKSSSTLESTKAYTKINDGGDEILPSSFGGAYNRFVTYTMTNIPTEYNSCYFNVSLSLEGVPSKVLATTVDLSSHFAFNNDFYGFFLTGILDGRRREVKADSMLWSEGNAAVFDTDFQVNDKFLVVQREGSIFKIWNSSILTSGTNGTQSFFTDDNGWMKATTAGDIRLYLNGLNQLWSDNQSPYTRVSVDPKLYLKGTVITADVANKWGENDAYELKSDRKDYAVLHHVYFGEGEFKVADKDWNQKWNYITDGDKAGNFVDGEDDGNITCTHAGYYDIFINSSRNLYIYASY